MTVTSAPAGDLKVDLLYKPAFMQTFKHAPTEMRRFHSGVHQILFDKANRFGGKSHPDAGVAVARMMTRQQEDEYASGREKTDATTFSLCSLESRSASNLRPISSNLRSFHCADSHTGGEAPAAGEGQGGGKTSEPKDDVTSSRFCCHVRRLHSEANVVCSAGADRKANKRAR